MQARQHTPLQANRDAPIFDILDRLDDVERQLGDALRLAQASCLGCQQALAAVAILRSRVSSGVLVNRALHEVARRYNGHGEPLWLVNSGVPIDEPSGPLTAREREVLVLIAHGRSNRQIAETLFLSPRTVERHVANIYLKLDVHTKAEATAWVLLHGCGDEQTPGTTSSCKPDGLASLGKLHTPIT